MVERPSFGKWLLQNLAGLAVVGPLVFFLLPHLVFGIPWGSLLPYFLAETLVLTLASPMLYWGATIGWMKSNWKPQLVIVGMTGAAVCWITFHYAAKLGVLSPAAARGSLVAMLITLPPAIVGGYYVNLKLFPERFSAQDERKQGGASCR
jgi:hypothetical protein